jgi:hypothetical protein
MDVRRSSTWAVRGRTCSFRKNNSAYIVVVHELGTQVMWMGVVFGAPEWPLLLYFWRTGQDVRKAWKHIDYGVLAPSRIFLLQDLEGLPLPSGEECDGYKLGHESIALVLRRWYI